MRVFILIVAVSFILAACGLESSVPGTSNTTLEPKPLTDPVVNASSYEPRDGYSADPLTKQEFASIIKRSGPYAVTLYGSDSERGLDDPYEKTFYRSGPDLEYHVGDYRYIENEDGAFLCEFNGSWTCERERIQLYDQLEASIRADPMAFAVRRTGILPFADTQGQCYVTELENVDATFCFEASGAPLRVSIERPGFESRFVATRYADETPPGAFELPAALE